GFPSHALVPEALSGRGLHLPIEARTTYRPDAPFTGRIEGALRDELGTPLEGVTVEARGRSASRRIRLRTPTGPEGRYRAENLPPGLYGIHVRASGTHQRIRLKDVAVESSGRTVLDLVARSR